MVRSKVSHGGVYLTTGHALLQKHSFFMVQSHFKSRVFLCVSAKTTLSFQFNSDNYILSSLKVIVKVAPRFSKITRLIEIYSVCPTFMSIPALVQSACF